MINNYEMVVILDPEQKAEEQEKLATKIKKFITDAEGKLSSAKQWGKKQLEYPVKKRTTGLFYLFNFTAPTEKAASLKQKVQLEENVLRFLLVVSEKGGQ